MKKKNKNTSQSDWAARRDVDQEQTRASSVASLKWSVLFLKLTKKKKSTKKKNWDGEDGSSTSVCACECFTIYFATSRLRSGMDSTCRRIEYCFGTFLRVYIASCWFIKCRRRVLTKALYLESQYLQWTVFSLSGSVKNSQTSAVLICCFWADRFFGFCCKGFSASFLFCNESEWMWMNRNDFFLFRFVQMTTLQNPRFGFCCYIHI